MGRMEEGAVAAATVEAVDAVTGASRKGEVTDAAVAPKAEVSVEGEGSAGASAADRVAETVDAVTGATWTTRNAIMARLFQEDLAACGDEMPAFRPPGS